MTDQPRTIPRTMTADDGYIAALQALTTLAHHMVQVSRLVDLDALREQLVACVTLAPLLEPTASNEEARNQIQNQRVFLDATIVYVQALHSLDRRTP